MARALRRRPIAAAALALSGLAAGCSGAEDPEPATPEPTPVTSAPSASPSPSPSAEDVDKPERPAAMDQHDADGAAAALEYFLALDLYAMRTGDVSDLEAMSHDSCEYCESRIEQAETIAERDDVFVGGSTTFTILTSYQQDAATGLWPLDVEIREDSATITDSAGEEVYESEDGVAQRRVEMGIVDGDWVVVEIGPIPED